MTLRYTRQGAQELDDAALYYDRRTPGLGQDFLDSLQRCLDQIEKSSRLFPEIDDRQAGREIRTDSIDRFPHVAVYEILPSELVLLAVAHHSRRPYYWIHRHG
jgi:hypothetical protein